MFTGVKYARIRTGRWHIYLHAPEHFATEWLLVNEVRQVRSYFTGPFFSALAHLRWGEGTLPIQEIASRLRSEGVGAEEADVVLRMFDLAYRDPDQCSARAIVEESMLFFPQYYYVLEELFAETLAHVRASGT
jgi:hypothetical protein